MTLGTGSDLSNKPESQLINPVGFFKIGSKKLSLAISKEIRFDPRKLQMFD